ncbi:MAG: primosomal protein N' [Candidatus Saccharibacteria bacterium]|nr:primosomal protein N' [Candidatus Saccharibacteria bacterium]
MNYYEIFVASKAKINQPLIYASSDELKTYQIVQIPFRTTNCLGFVLKKIPSTEISASLKRKCRGISITSQYRLPEILVKSVLNFATNSSLTVSMVANLLLSNAHLKEIKFEKLKIDIPKKKFLPLTKSQDEIYQKIKQNETSKPQLLLGVNGSGKTRLYAELIKDCYQVGQSSLILVPEIGLSQQIFQLLKEYLNLPILLYHSQLKSSQKKQLWIQCLKQKPVIIIGPRSSEFLPLPSLGLIIMDEFHDDSYKQNSQPTYHSLHFASILAKEHGARFICGSATPRIEDYYHFQKADYPIYHLNQKVLKTIPPEILIVERSTQHLLMPQTLDVILHTIQNKHQALIFYNQRGHWRLAQCQTCLKYIECSNCFRKLVFHKDRFKLICHGCGLARRPLSVCPSCQKAIRYSQLGIKAVADELKKELLKVNLKTPIWRFDSDNPKSETLASKLTQINKQSDLIILGTQVISQGLDLTNLQTVVVLDADQNLQFPDYRTQERYYRYIHQISGRVGRGHLDETKVVLQTALTDDFVLKCAVRQDWLKFYQYELKQRQQYQLPPFVHLANIVIRRSNQESTKKVATELYNHLRAKFKADLKIYPPNPSLREKQGKNYEWLIHLSTQKRTNLIKVIDYLKDSEYFINLDPSQLFESGI